MRPVSASSQFQAAQQLSMISSVVRKSLYCLCCEGEPAPYVLIGASTGEQAQKIFHPGPN